MCIIFYVCVCVCVCMMSVIAAEKATLSLEIRLKLLYSCAAAAELHTRLKSRQHTDFKDQLICIQVQNMIDSLICVALCIRSVYAAN